MARKVEEFGLLTVAEVAETMRVSKMTIYRLCHSGELESLRVGRSFRIPARAVEKYLSPPDSMAGAGRQIVYTPLPNGAGLVPLPGDQPNEAGNIPIGSTDEEAWLPEDLHIPNH